MGWDEDVHRRERDRRREGIEEQGAAEAAGDGEDDREHDDEAGVEEDREPEEQGRHPERERCPLLTEDPDETVGEHFGSAGELEEATEHGAEAHEEGDAGQGRAEAVVEDVDEVGRADARRKRGEDADDDEGDEGVEAQTDDEDEEEPDRCGGDAEEGGCGKGPGQVDLGHASSSSRVGLGRVSAAKWWGRRSTMVRHTSVSGCSIETIMCASSGSRGSRVASWD